MDNIDKLKNYIVDNFLFGQDDSLDNDTDFFEKGIIDSIGIIDLVCFVEVSFDISVNDDELIAKNFSSLKNLNNYINFKKQKQTKG